MKIFEVHYQSPEGPKVTKIKVVDAHNATRIIADLMKNGLSVDRQDDILYLPPHSIIAITYAKKA